MRTFCPIRESRGQLAQVVRLDVRRHNERPVVHQVARLVADTRTDFENARAEEAFEALVQPGGYRGSVRPCAAE